MNREIKFRAWHKELEDMSLSKGNESAFWSKVTLYQEMYEIMQFTGLTDKNNTEIYEGDIVIKNAIKKVVAWKVGKVLCGFNIGKGYEYSTPKTDCSIEVIGNIYANPDLI